MQRLYDDLRQLRQQESAQASGRTPNGPAKPPNPAPERSPAFFTLTPAEGQDIVLVPLDPRAAQLQSPPQSADAEAPHAPRLGRDDRSLSPEEVLALSLDEQRVLVCTTFVGDASPDMAFFNQWLDKMPSSASKITVEGMFLGPPTMLLISMPHSVWNIIQHDKVCCFLGYISSHNMIHLYQRLVNSARSGLLASRDPEDDRPRKRSLAAQRPEQPSHLPSLHKGTPPRPGNHLSQAATATGAPPLSRETSAWAAAVAPKDEVVEDSAEMQEAAEQLKALSHVRHMGDDAPATVDRQIARVGDSIAVRHVGDAGSPSEAMEPAVDGGLYESEYGTPSAKPKPRRPLQKQTPKQETRCSHCSHAPFKDSSSLRKHIAAAHTRPFPCAFTFAGCTSTFGSKNEWKRHIASQHLCLQYYRCSSCPQSSADGKGNEFNRKDLFTQHLRRMHAPFAIKKAISKGDSKLQAEWDAHVKEMQASCLVTRRQPPQRSACPKPDCQSVFEGPGSWDEWTEHVGRHMEKGEAQRLGVDRLLAKWALDEGIIEPNGEGGYRLCGGNGSANGTSAGNGNRSPSVLERAADPAASNGNNKPSLPPPPLADGAGRRDQDEEDPSITVAMPGQAAENMEVD